MKKILFVKLTSLGDLIHALPALSDAKRAHPELMVDWVIDENFQEVATWHEAVGKVFPTNHRKWRKNLFASFAPICHLAKSIRGEQYDLILDGQGNFKSALIALLGKGVRAGFDRESVRERVAQVVYQKKYSASWKIHAIDRLRKLFSDALGYVLPTNEPDFGLLLERFQDPGLELPSSYYVFVPNATWETKLWPEEHWIELIKRVAEPVLLPWGNGKERERAERIAGGAPNGVVLPKLRLSEIGFILARAKGCVSLDTGFSHLAAALKIPTVTLYGATDAALIGASGSLQIQSQRFCSPCNQKKCRYFKEPLCMKEMTPDLVWERLACPRKVRACQETIKQT